MKSGRLGVKVAGMVALGLAMGAAQAAGAAAKDEATLLLAPARPRVVQLAFDMAALRPKEMEIVAWHGAAKTAEPVLHAWFGSDWQYLRLSDFAGKTFTDARIRKVIVIGDDEIVPGALLDNMPWCADVERLKTLDVAELINGLDRILKFREGEWKWLADRYGLTLADLNAEKRNRNPYDIPRSKLPLEKREYKQEKGEPPPAELIERQPADAAPVSAPMPAAGKAPAPEAAPAEKPLK